MKEELADFLRFCSVEHRLAPLTCAAYERDVSACLGYLQGEGVMNLADVRPTHLRAFLAEDAKRRPAPSSQGGATAALKSFFRFLVDDERLDRDPGATAAQAEEARGAPGPLVPAPVRAEGKGRPAARRPDPPRPAPLFAAYYATRVPLTEQAIFVGIQGKPLNYTQLGQGLPPLRRGGGVGERKRVTPHTLRHVFASELLRAGANVRQVQELLGHKHLDSTQRYTRVTAHELCGAVKRLRWVG